MRRVFLPGGAALVPGAAPRRTRPGTKVAVAVAAFSAAAFLAPASANAISGGQPVADGADSFAAKITMDGAACSGALIAPQWVITAASCFPGSSGQAAPPAKPATVQVGQADLRGAGGQALRVSQVVARGDRDVALAKLTYPVQGVTPLAVSATAPGAGESVRVDGYGRTATEWVPDRLATGQYTLGQATATTVAMTSPTGNDICLGDAGGPVLRQESGGLRLAGIASRSWQHGCLAVTETRSGSTAARTDDIAAWITQQIEPRSIRLTNHYSKRCLAVQGANNVDDAPVYQFDCPSAYDDQAWDIEPNAAGGVLLRNHATKRCLIVHGADNTNGAPALQYECLPQFTDQLWDLVEVDGGVQVRNRATNRCLLVAAANNENGAKAVQYDCLPQFSDQVWEKTAVPDAVLVTNHATQRCLIVHGANNVNDAPALQYDCLPQFTDQLWEIDPVASGGVLVRNRATKRCLIVHGGNNVNDAPALQYECLPQFTDQLWDIIRVPGGVQLKNRATNRCLIVHGGNNVNDGSAVQYDCLPQFTDQIWDVLPLPAGS
ncbi:RICIN domain-containing protein [Amycolatopsis sp. NPDC021455]|uniref:RICIN domain-containing protein n=1 Tax=Amycolatopsis sp. NPDC021455 TaxID=3154901 RepID=UPI0033C6A029